MRWEEGGGRRESRCGSESRRRGVCWEGGRQQEGESDGEEKGQMVSEREQEKKKRKGVCVTARKGYQ
jgi:hypothetical protein